MQAVHVRADTVVKWWRSSGGSGAEPAAAAAEAWAYLYGKTKSGARNAALIDKWVEDVKAIQSDMLQMQAELPGILKEKAERHAAAQGRGLVVFVAVAQIVGGSVEVAGGLFMTGGTGGAAAIPGIGMAVLGADNVYAGWNSLFSGKIQKTYVRTATTGMLGDYWGGWADFGIGLGAGLGAGVGTAAYRAHMLKTAIIEAEEAALKKAAERQVARSIAGQVLDAPPSLPSAGPVPDQRFGLGLGIIRPGGTPDPSLHSVYVDIANTQTSSNLARYNWWAPLFGQKKAAGVDEIVAALNTETTFARLSNWRAAVFTPSDKHPGLTTYWLQGNPFGWFGRRAGAHELTHLV